jgi:hypothetical protein
MIENKLLEAILCKCEAERTEALAILDVYLTRPVGIGEHSDLITEINKYTELLASAEDKLESLKRNFS